MLTHYLELLRHFRRTIFFGTLFAGVLALGLSLLLQRSMPIFEATVTLNMQPSEEELRFNSGFLGVSQFNPATIIAQTHIERLLSRQVVDRAVEILIEQSGGVLPLDPPSAFDRFKKGFRRWYNLMNFGYFEEPDQREAYVTDLINATEVEIVEGSYILLVSVSYDNPEIAARAANALAQAYVDQTKAEFQADAIRVDTSLENAVRTREEDLARLQTERQDVARSLGFSDIASERAILLDTRSLARAALQNAEVEQSLLATRVASLETAILSQSDAEVVRQLRQSLAETIASRAAVEENLKLRTNALAQADEGLRKLEVAEDVLYRIDERISTVDSDLEELRNRRVGTRLAREAQLSQIRTINSARAPVYPKFPKVLINTIVGFIVGGILVLVPITAMDVLGNRIRTSEDLRQSFGGRVLPPITQGIVQEARQFNANGGHPGRALYRYAQAARRRLIPVGPGQGPLDVLPVTAFGGEEDISKLYEVIEAVLRITSPEKVGQTQRQAVKLSPISNIDNWDKLQGSQIVIALRPSTLDRNDVASFSENTVGATAYVVMLM